MEGNPINKDTNIEDHLNGASISMESNPRLTHEEATTT